MDEWKNPAQEKLADLPKCVECGGFLVRIDSGYVCLEGHGKINSQGVTDKKLKDLLAKSKLPVVEPIYLIADDGAK